MTDTKNKNLSKVILKYLPGISLGILTISLILFFKSQSGNNIYDAGKNNLVDFYFANLKPLITKTEFSNEDLFNFAIYSNLPIDKNNGSLLHVGHNEGAEFVELKEEIFKPNTNNYNKFKHYLQLNDKQSSALDSIIDSYQDDLYASILYNDQNSVAINPNINSIRRALFTDITLYAQSIDPRRSKQFIDRRVSRRDAIRIRSLTHDYRESNQNEYILFAPDTILTSSLELANNEKFDRKSKSLEKWDRLKIVKMINDVEPVEKILPVRIVENRDNKNYLYPKAYFPTSNRVASSDQMDSLIIALDDVESKMKDLQFVFDVDSSHNNFHFTYSADSNATVGFDINTSELNELINTAVEVSIGASVNWENFGIKMDSLARVIEHQYADSNFLYDSSAFDMKSFEKELKRKRKEKREQNK